ncbi:MAG: hypothetical protein AAGJ52_00770 [Pseudomonadota bacterium]
MPLNLARLLTGAAFVLASGVLSAQPMGPVEAREFRINSFELGDQRIPLVASDSFGRAVVIWQSLGQEEPGWTIYAQRLDADQALTGEEFQINDYNVGSQDGQSIVMAADGRFAVAWNGPDSASTTDVISLRRFDPAGLPVAGDQRISENTGSTQLLPRLALMGGDELMVSWESSDPIDNFNILSRRAGASGMALGPITPLNVSAPGAQRRGDVVSAPDGSLYAVWQDAVLDGSDWGVFLRCLDPLGQGSPEIQVNQFTVGQQSRPRIARGRNGELAVVWQDNMGMSSFVYRRIMARVFDSNCQPLGPELQVNMLDDGIQDQPTLAADALGDFVIAWQSFPEDFTLQGIYGRRLGASGDFLSDEFEVSLEVEAFQDFPAVTGLPDGGYLFVWESAGQDESGFGVYARRFLGPRASEIDILAGAGQTTESNQPFAEDLVVEVRDEWGDPRVGELLRLSSSSTSAGVLFPNGQSTIEQATDAAGRLQIALRANAFGGDHDVLIEASSSGLRQRVALTNLGPAGLPQTLPVPGLGPWALLIFAMLVLVMVRPRL